MARHEGLTATVDLPSQLILLHAPAPVTYLFEIDASRKAQLIEGIDDIDLTLQYEADISQFESRFDPLISQL